MGGAEAPLRVLGDVALDAGIIPNNPEIGARNELEASRMREGPLTERKLRLPTGAPRLCRLARTPEERN
jgi:hypothetical protein